MAKGLKGFLHLVAGIGFLLGAAYTFVELGDQGHAWWREHSPLADGTAGMVNAGGAGKSGTVGPNVAVYGVLGEHEIAGGQRDGKTPVADGSGVNGASADGPENGASANAAVSEASASIDRVARETAGWTDQLVHGRLSVTTYQTLTFELPAHKRGGHVEGTFRCVETGNAGRGAVEVLLMNEEEFARFGRDETERSTFWVSPAGNRDIDWDLKPTFGEPEKYYLVFRNASRRRGAAVVEADFVVTAE